MIERADTERPKPRGALLMLADYLPQPPTPRNEEAELEAYVDQRARWNELGREMGPAELADAMAIICAWRTAGRQFGRR